MERNSEQWLVQPGEYRIDALWVFISEEPGEPVRDWPSVWRCTSRVSDVLDDPLLASRLGAKRKT